MLYEHVDGDTRRHELRMQLKKELQSMKEDRPYLSHSEKRLISLENGPRISTGDPIWLQPEDFLYKMTRFPKLSFANFHKRPLWEVGQTLGPDV